MTCHHGSLQCLLLAWPLSPARGPTLRAAGTDQWPIPAGNNSHINFTHINLYPEINRHMKMGVKITFVIFLLTLYCLKTEGAPPQSQITGTVKPTLHYSSCNPDNIYCAM